MTGRSSQIQDRCPGPVLAIPEHMKIEPRFVETVEQLKTLLRAERSAVAVYENALAGVRDVYLAVQLERCRLSHHQRTTSLQAAIDRYARDPGYESDVPGWESFPRLFKTAGRDAAIAALEEGEDFGLHGYRESLRMLDGVGRTLVIDVLLPEQFAIQGVVKQMKQHDHASI